MKGKILQTKYKILKVLGRSTFSETFLAKDKQWYARDRYVIKKFRPILGNPQAKAIREQFYREASVLKLLSGENSQIPQLYAYFMDGEDFYLVREWIGGITLEQKVRQQGKLSETEVTEILSSILSVLKYIHNYGIVYRQLKPSSIVLRQSRWGDLAKWQEQKRTPDGLPVPIYFGGVKNIEQKVATLNRPSLVLAERHGYTSPEQERGASVYASDLYSLGLTAIYLLTGKTPAELELDPYTKSPLWRQEVPQVSNNLARAIDRAICPSTGDRFASAEEMLCFLNPRSVNISESIITLPEPKPVLTPEIKITAALSVLSLGVLATAFAILNLNLEQFFSNYGEEELIGETEVSEPEITPVPESQEKPQVTASAEPPLKIPAFRVDSPQEQIFDLLGQPTTKSPGYWGNSQAYAYQNFIPELVDLGYLIDIDTQEIRQTEISFADSVKNVEAHRAMRLMLLDNYSTEIEQKIDLVFNQKSDEQQFAVGDLKGIIQRNEQNRIYIAIWKRGFHQ